MATATVAAPRKRARSGGTAVTLNAANLREALDRVAAAVPAKSPKPILHNVLIGDGRITANDLELQISTEIDYSGPTILLPHARLRAILREAHGEDVSLAIDGIACVVSCGNGEWRLPTEDAAEFPVSDPEGLKPLFHLPCDQFVRAVSSVSYATDRESSRYALGAVLAEVDEEGVSFVATDGRRLSTYAAEFEHSLDASKTLFPGGAIETLVKLAEPHGESSVDVEGNGREIRCTLPGVVLTARLLEGAFPRWRDVIPQDRDCKATAVIADELAAATRAASICTSEASKGVVFAITDQGLHLTSRSSEFGEASVTCPLVDPGDPVTVTMDPHYVVDYLRHLGKGADPVVEIEASGPGDAVVFRCGDAIGVVMPLDPNAA